MFGYKLVRTKKLQVQAAELSDFVAYVDEHMVMKDSKGKSEDGNYDKGEVSCLWAWYFDKERKVGNIIRRWR